MSLERALHKKYNRIPMVVVQRLASNNVKRCVGALGLTEIINDTDTMLLLRRDPCAIRRGLLRYEK